MNKERKLQSQMVLEFSQQRPEEKGMLWSTRNTTFNTKDGATQKALGMVAGVSDLIYFKEAYLMGIEVKYPLEKHSVDQVRKQYEWGKKISEEYGDYFIVTSLKGFWDAINSDGYNSKYCYTIEDIDMKLSASKSKISFYETKD